MNARSLPLPASLAVIAMLAGCAGRLPAADHQFRWSFSAAESANSSRLFYGVEETDIIDVGFTCVPGSGRAAIQLYGPDIPSHTVELRAGGFSAPYDVKIEEADEPIFEAQVDPGHPMIAAFRDTGKLRIVSPTGEADVGASSGAERKAIADFWGSCRA